MKNRFVFVGNRRFVLQEMLNENVNLIRVIVIADSHLHRDLANGILKIDYSVVNSRVELLELLAVSSYDILISNGCSYVLPILKLPSAQYVNIHPSCLPDLRGIDPVIGSMLYERDSGASCHVMDSGVDTGAIISQVRIPFSNDLDVTTLYQLSFIAEQMVFKQALERKFIPQFIQKTSSNDIYYSRCDKDRIITFQESNDFILRKIKAFNNQSQGCEFTVNGQYFKVYMASRLYNQFLLGFSMKFEEGVVVLSYENNIIFRKDGELLRFMDVVSLTGNIFCSGDQLYPT